MRPRPRSFRLHVFAWATLAGAWAGPSVAQNLLENADFDDGISAWAAARGSLSWNGSADIDGCAGSGAAEIDGAELDGGSYKLELVSDGSCADVVPGEEITIHVRMLPVVGAAATEFKLLAYTDDACTAGEAEQGIAGYGTLPSIWLNIMLGSTIQPGVQSVRLLVRSTDPALSTIASRFDRTYLGRGFRLFSDTFEAGSPCRWTTTAP